MSAKSSPDSAAPACKWCAERRPTYHLIKGSALPCERVEQLAERVEQLERENAELVELAQKMGGFVKPYALDDQGSKSEFDKWKICRDKIAALARSDTTKKELTSVEKQPVNDPTLHELYDVWKDRK